MTIRVKLPNGKFGIFPDGMPHDQIELVLQKQFPIEKQEQDPRGEAVLRAQAKFKEYAPNLFDTIKSVMSTIGSPVASAGLGLEQGLSEMGTSIANTPAYLKEIYTGKEQPRHKSIDFSHNISDDALSRLLFRGGELAAPLMLPFGAASKAASYAGKVGAGALTGFLTGEDPSGSRLLSTAAGAVLPAAYETGKDLLKLSYGNIGRDVVKTKKAIQKYFNEHYGDLWNSVNERGLGGPRLNPFVPEEHLIPFLTKEAKAAIKRFNENPTLQESHELQSDLGKLGAQIKSGAGTFLERKNAEDLFHAQKELREKTIEHLIQSGHPDLGIKYSSLTHHYSKDLGPYLKSHVANIEKALNEGTLPRAEISKMLSDKEFRKAVKGQHLGLEERAQINELYRKMKDLGVPVLQLLGVQKLFGM